jgi:hypothetical protein
LTKNSFAPKLKRCSGKRPTALAVRRFRKQIQQTAGDLLPEALRQHDLHIAKLARIGF